MQQYQVVGGLVASPDRLLLVENVRRDARRDWSPPGGLVDPGELPLDALTREVVEESGLVVREWSEAVYTVEVTFVSVDWHLSVACHVARRWEGELTVDDPDGIVDDARFCLDAEARDLLLTAPRWVAEPLVTWLDDPDGGPVHHAYEVDGADRSAISVRRVGS